MSAGVYGVEAFKLFHSICLRRKRTRKPNGKLLLSSSRSLSQRTQFDWLYIERKCLWYWSIQFVYSGKMVKGIRKTKKSNDRVVLQTTARTERIKKMENNATQNQIKPLQNIAGLAAVRMFTDQTSQLKDSRSPSPLTTTDHQAGLRQLK